MFFFGAHMRRTWLYPLNSGVTSVGLACWTCPSRIALVHDLRVVVDSAPTTHAKVAPVPTPAFSSSPVPPLALRPHSRTRTTPSPISCSLAHPRSSTAVCHGLGPVSRPSSGPRRVHCPSELHLDTSNSGHTSVRPFPL
jgi:hypothetical protein